MLRLWHVLELSKIPIGAPIGLTQLALEPALVGALVIAPTYTNAPGTRATGVDALGHGGLWRVADVEGAILRTVITTTLHVERFRDDM